MKIQELLENELKRNSKEPQIFDTEIKKFKSKKNEFKYERDRDKFEDKQGLDYSKEGAYGRVYSKPNEHTLTKIPHQAKESDPYFYYISYVAKNKLAQSNPFFPRVYEIKQWKDTNGYSKYKIEIERLVSLEEVEPEIIENMCYNLFSKEDVEHSFNTVKDWHTTASEFWPTILALLISSCIEESLPPLDSNLSKACKILNKIQKEHFLDLHFGNIMIRRSPYPQLVIVDPFS